MSKPVIILKLDDLVHEGATTLPVSDRWQRCVDFLKSRQVKSSLGVIGYSLEEKNDRYFNWIKAEQAGGLIEFWNHGHWRRTMEDTIGEFEKSFEEQRTSLMRTQQLGREKLGIEFRVFGVHWSGINESTDRAMLSVPEIRIWLNGPEKPMGKQTNLKFAIQLEQPIFCPNFEAVSREYNQIGRSEPYLLLQGHPPGWDEDRFQQFTQIVEFLLREGCEFMKPSEYVAKAMPAG